MQMDESVLNSKWISAEQFIDDIEISNNREKMAETLRLLVRTTCL